VQLTEVEQLKQAIDTNDVDRVAAMMTRDPTLHRAPLGYGNDGPLTWVAECRVPWESPSGERLAMAEWMLTHGSDVHQGGDAPLMRASLNGYRIPMMDLLVGHGADVNAKWHGHFPVIFAPCESVDPDALGWLLDHGADPNCRDPRHSAAGERFPGAALDYLIASYARSPERLSRCIGLLLAAGGETKYAEPAVLALLRGRLDLLGELLDADRSLTEERFAGLDCGMTGRRRLTLEGATLLHVAAEYGNAAAVALLLERGVDVNAGATLKAGGVGGQTAIFHAVSQFDDDGLAVTELLLERGADLAVRVTLPGDYERPGETVECTPLGYALRFGGSSQRKTVALLRARGAIE
jgi:ankyrin repeat protein